MSAAVAAAAASSAAAAPAASTSSSLLSGEDMLAELQQTVQSELDAFVRQASLPVKLPPVQRCKDVRFGDFTVVMRGALALLEKQYVERKETPPSQSELWQVLLKKLSTYVEERGDATLIMRAEEKNGYLNIFLHRPRVMKAALSNVFARGSKFGHTTGMQGKRVIIEHTSSNPNAPLHIGNLRNSLLGAHLSQLMSAVGYDVKQYFYVNDLGAQIGLTALGYHRVYTKIRPELKIDQWIGMMYAIMNTFSELQKVGVTLDAADQFVNHGGDKPAGTDKDKADEYLDIFADLQSRQPRLFAVLLEDMKANYPNIKQSAGELNLRYEENDSNAVRIFRKMVTDCLSGIQQTLDTYNVRHDRWDFESELGWEGSNDRVIGVIKGSPYFVPQTPQKGGYFDLARYIEDAGFPTGKKGFVKEYPPLFVVRPDGSTLYTFRDVVYSLKKCTEADMVLNVICSEQNLAQEKVKLAMGVLNPELALKQLHVSYELVRLPEGRMSGRRGRYLLADELYEDLKAEIVKTMSARAEGQHEVATSEFEAATHQVATAAMKYALLSSGPNRQISFDINRITSFEDASAPFMLYNSTRLNSLLRKFTEKVAAGELPAMPEDLSTLDYSVLDDDQEWNLLLNFMVPFADMVKTAACPALPQPPQLPEFGTHKVCDFLLLLVNEVSSYYKRVRILDTSGRGGAGGMHARLAFLKAVRQLIDNALRLLTIEPLERM